LAGHVTRTREINAYIILIEELERHARRWKNDVRMDFGESRVGNCGVDSSGSRYGPVTDFLNLVMNLGVS
jgi:hypothetical protein